MVGFEREQKAKELRRTLLDEQRDALPPSMLDCCAHMLLYFDEPTSMRRIALSHLIDRLSASRADIGFGSPTDPVYRACSVLQRSDCAIPEILGLALPNRDHAIQVVWQSRHALHFNVERDSVFEQIRPTIHELGIRAKMACRLEFDQAPFGIICVDQTEEKDSWREADIAYFDLFATRILSPLIGESLGQDQAKPNLLTSAERAVILLASQGLSYKKIANALGKSPNTVDNQLRKIRTKLGARNQVELAHACRHLLNG